MGGLSAARPSERCRDGGVDGDGEVNQRHVGGGGLNKGAAGAAVGAGAGAAVGVGSGNRVDSGGVVGGALGGGGISAAPRSLALGGEGAFVGALGAAAGVAIGVGGGGSGNALDDG